MTGARVRERFPVVQYYTIGMRHDVGDGEEGLSSYDESLVIGTCCKQDLDQWTIALFHPGNSPIIQKNTNTVTQGNPAPFDFNSKNPIDHHGSWIEPLVVGILR